MDAKVRALKEKAWSSAAAIGGATMAGALSATAWAQKRAAHYTPGALLQRRQRARQWTLLKEAAVVATAYGARAALRHFLPAARKGRGPSKA